MAIDFEKIKQKVEQLSGKAKKNSVLWSPQNGKEYKIRILPWPDGNDGTPFKERSFHYNIGQGRSILSLSQFKKPDPIQELITKLRKGGSASELDLAKKLYSKRRYFAPIIIRGEEDQGVKLWSFGKQICDILLQAMIGDFGDITDIKEGRDITVTSTPKAGSEWNDVKVMPRGVTSELSKDKKQAAEWLKSVPNLDEIYQPMSYEEVDKRLNDFINGTSSSTGTEVRVSPPVNQTSDAVEPDDIDAVFNKLNSVTDD